MANNSDNILAALGFGGVIGAALRQSEVNRQKVNVGLLRQENLRLSAFYQSWRPFAEQFINRKTTLAKYQLDKTVYSIGGVVRASYCEALRCYLFQRDLAAASMICLTIETLLREVAKDDHTPLFQVIDNIEKSHNLSPNLKKQLHILRQMRNVQSHKVNKLDEISLLSLFQCVGDLHRAFR